MLQDVRQGMQGTTAKVVVWGIALTFALFGVESIVGGIGGEPEVAEVNGEGIPKSEFQMAVERKKRQLLMQMGESADPELIDEGLLSQSVLEGMIQEKALEQDASNKGLYISIAMVDEYIRNMNEFQVDGAFSNERMQAVLGSAGFSLGTFRERLAKQVVLDQSRSAFVGSAFVLENEKNRVLQLDRQTRDFGLALLPAANYMDQIETLDSELNEYYSQNQSQFEAPESVDITYLTLRKSALGDVDVTEEEIQARYDLELQDFVGDEERRAAHILVAIDDAVNEEEALSKAQDIKARIDAGEDFSGLAKAESSDEGSAVEGGDLGFSGKGVYVSGFEDALFSLSKDQVSEPVKTEFGYHIIKLLDIQTNEPASVAERSSVITEEIRQEKLNNLYVDLSQQLADISYSSSGLEEPAEELGLVVETKSRVSGSIQDDIFSNPKVQRALFSQENVSGENNSELIELDEGVSLVFNVTNYNPAAVQPFDDVKGAIEKIVQLRKATKFAESIAQAFIVRVEAGEAAHLVAAEMDLAWEEKASIRRDDFSVSQELLLKVFAMDKPASGAEQVAGFELGSGDYAVVALSSVAEGSLDDITMIEEQSIDGSLGASYGGADYSAYMQSVESSAVVERL